MKIHIVQQGDTLWKLAKKYDVDFEQLKAVNNHLSNPDVIMPGMKIKIQLVPVKKQTIKKKEPMQMKEQPKAKEMPLPKKEEVKVPPPPKVPEEIKKPEPIIQQPITNEQYLQNMNMNFNIYKPVPPQPIQPKVPEPPKMKRQNQWFHRHYQHHQKKKYQSQLYLYSNLLHNQHHYKCNHKSCYPVTGVMPGVFL
ncbi:SafA/ExsA family spore coat assembly protein [Anaerobacillus sp. HL2]|nr:SafA/ExsA family spore coat assembly protein [Anaerobacillus sp. HL2]